MATNALVATLAIFVGGAVYLLQECTFLVPHKTLIFERYLPAILLQAALFFLNVYAAVFLLGRKLFLKDTGRKLAHLEKQIRTGQITSELAERLKE